MSWELRNEWGFAKQIEEVGVGRGKGIPHRGNISSGRGLPEPANMVESWL